MKEYIKAWTVDNPVRTLIIDTKPRFKAQWELNGFSTRVTKRYAKWGYGSGVLEGSFVLSGSRNIRAELDQVWRLGGNIAIVHTERETEWSHAADVATTFYESYGAGIPRLIVVDELADFFKWRGLGDIFQRVARNGRERDCALLTGSQRPRKVPVETLTEMRRLYMFKLDFLEDIKHVWAFGIPRGTRRPNGHVFYMFDKDLESEAPSDRYYQLSI